jgi:hypothetical protein
MARERIGIASTFPLSLFYHRKFKKLNQGANLTMAAAVLPAAVATFEMTAPWALSGAVAPMAVAE